MKLNQSRRIDISETLNSSESYQAYLKSPYKSIKHSTYFHVYDELFSRYRDKEITFVEIGVFGGGSLFMWRNFFGSKARIIGIDLNPDAKELEKYGFEIFIGNQSDEVFWIDVIKNIGNIDVVLDDGGHTYLQQIVTTKMLLPHISDNGMLVVEDTHTSYMDGYGPRNYSFIKYVKNMIDFLNFRFSELSSHNRDEYTWSIQCFESIVAFYINRERAKLLSQPTTNNGVDISPKDYFSHGNSLAGVANKIPSWAKKLKKFRAFNYMGKRVTSFIYNQSSSTRVLKEYFKN